MQYKAPLCLGLASALVVASVVPNMAAGGSGISCNPADRWERSNQVDEDTSSSVNVEEAATSTGEADDALELRSRIISDNSNPATLNENVSETSFNNIEQAGGWGSMQQDALNLPEVQKVVGEADGQLAADAANMADSARSGLGAADKIIVEDEDRAAISQMMGETEKIEVDAADIFMWAQMAAQFIVTAIEETGKASHASENLDGLTFSEIYIGFIPILGQLYGLVVDMYRDNVASSGNVLYSFEMWLIQFSQALVDFFTISESHLDGFFGALLKWASLQGTSDNIVKGLISKSQSTIIDQENRIRVLGIDGAPECPPGSVKQGDAFCRVTTVAANALKGQKLNLDENAHLWVWVDKKEKRCLSGFKAEGNRCYLIKPASFALNNIMRVGPLAASSVPPHYNDGGYIIFPRNPPLCEEGTTWKDYKQLCHVDSAGWYNMGGRNSWISNGIVYTDAATEVHTDACPGDFFFNGKNCECPDQINMDGRQIQVYGDTLFVTPILYDTKSHLTYLTDHNVYKHHSDRYNFLAQENWISKGKFDDQVIENSLSRLKSTVARAKLIYPSALLQKENSKKVRMEISVLKSIFSFHVAISELVRQLAGKTEVLNSLYYSQATKFLNLSHEGLVSCSNLHRNPDSFSSEADALSLMVYCLNVSAKENILNFSDFNVEQGTERLNDSYEKVYKQREDLITKIYGFVDERRTTSQGHFDKDIDAIKKDLSKKESNARLFDDVTEKIKTGGKAVFDSIMNSKSLRCVFNHIEGRKNNCTLRAVIPFKDPVVGDCDNSDTSASMNVVCFGDKDGVSDYLGSLAGSIKDSIVFSQQSSHQADFSCGKPFIFIDDCTPDIFTYEYDPDKDHEFNPDAKSSAASEKGSIKQVKDYYVANYQDGSKSPYSFNIDEYAKNLKGEKHGEIYPNRSKSSIGDQNLRSLFSFYDDDDISTKKIYNEGDKIKIEKASFVRYGASDDFIFKEVDPGTIVCNSSVFGKRLDSVPGKKCLVIDSTYVAALQKEESQMFSSTPFMYIGFNDFIMQLLDYDNENALKGFLDTSVKNGNLNYLSYAFMDFSREYCAKQWNKNKKGEVNKKCSNLILPYSRGILNYMMGLDGFHVIKDKDKKNIFKMKDAIYAAPPTGKNKKDNIANIALYSLGLGLEGYNLDLNALQHKYGKGFQLLDYPGILYMSRLFEQANFDFGGWMKNIKKGGGKEDANKMMSKNDIQAALKGFVNNDAGKGSDLYDRSKKLLSYIASQVSEKKIKSPDSPAYRQSRITTPVFNSALSVLTSSDTMKALVKNKGIEGKEYNLAGAGWKTSINKADALLLPSKNEDNCIVVGPQKNTSSDKQAVSFHRKTNASLKIDLPPEKGVKKEKTIVYHDALKASFAIPCIDKNTYKKKDHHLDYLFEAQVGVAGKDYTFSLNDNGHFSVRSGTKVIKVFDKFSKLDDYYCSDSGKKRDPVKTQPNDLIYVEVYFGKNSIYQLYLNKEQYIPDNVKKKADTVYKVMVNKVLAAGFVSDGDFANIDIENFSVNMNYQNDGHIGLYNPSVNYYNYPVLHQKKNH